MSFGELHPSSRTTPSILPQLEELRFAAAKEDALIASLHQLQPINHSQASLAELVQHTLSRVRITGGELRIGMYDGSFDPPHFGHAEVAHAAKAFARLDLLVINCHPKPNYLKPDLAPHAIRAEMLSSYFPDAEGILVSPLSRAEIESLIRPCRVIGVIGSDTFNRFLRDGIAQDFNTDEIFVAERTTDLLREAPHELDGRPVLYAGAAVLSHNRDSSSVVKHSLPQLFNTTRHPLLNEVTDALVRRHTLYQSMGASSPTAPIRAESAGLDDRRTPTQYQGCTVTRRLGLHNGLLSESFVHEVRSASGEVVAFMKQMPPHRDPASMISDEGAGLAIFNLLGIASVKAPSCVVTQDPPTLWVERAPGRTLSSAITAYDRGEETEQAVYDFIHRVGDLLGKIHRNHQQSFDQKARDLLEGHIAHHEDLIAKASGQQLMNLELQEAIRIYREKANILRSQGVQCSLLHGDANPGNFLWDGSSEMLHVIDLQRLGTQIRTGGAGFSTLEFFSFLRTLYHFPNIGFKGRRGGLKDAVSIYRNAHGPVSEHEEQMFEKMWVVRKNLAGNVRLHGIEPVQTATGDCKR